MPATIADIAAGTREAETVRWADPDIAARYPTARDGSTVPAEGFFDDLDDAADVMAQRGALIGTDRRRFAETVEGLIWPGTNAVPSVTLVDDELGANAAFLVARPELNLEAETTSYELFG